MTHRSRALRILIVSVILPLVIAAVGIAVTWVTAAHSPSSVPVHFDAAGRPNSSGSPFIYPTLMAVVCVPLIVILGGTALLVSQRRPFTVMLKTLGVSTLWLPIALSIILSAAAFAAQSGSRLSPGLWLGVGFGGAFVVALGGWFVLPRIERVPGSETAATQSVPLGTDERASWLRSTSASAGLIWAFVGLTVFVSGISAFAIISSGGVVWEVSLIPVVLMLLTLASFAWHVRVDARGVEVRSILGVPRFRIPLEGVVSAESRRVDAFSEFGGWGIRFGLNGRLGIIVRSGDALEIKRKKGLALVVTVDDAASAAALLNGLVERQARGGA